MSVDVLEDLTKQYYFKCALCDPDGTTSVQDRWKSAEQLGIIGTKLVLVYARMKDYSCAFVCGSMQKNAIGPVAWDGRCVKKEPTARSTWHPPVTQCNCNTT